MGNNLLANVWGAVKDKYNQVTSPDYWTPNAILNRMATGMQNAIHDPSGLIGGGMGGMVEDVGRFLKPAIFDAQGFHLPDASIQRLLNAAQASGHDGLIIKNTLGGGDVQMPTQNNLIGQMNGQPPNPVIQILTTKQ